MSAYLVFTRDVGTRRTPESSRGPGISGVHSQRRFKPGADAISVPFLSLSNIV